MVATALRRYKLTLCYTGKYAWSNTAFMTMFPHAVTGVVTTPTGPALRHQLDYGVVMSEAAHSSTYVTRSSQGVLHPAGWALLPTGVRPWQLVCPVVILLGRLVLTHRIHVFRS